MTSCMQIRALTTGYMTGAGFYRCVRDAFCLFFPPRLLHMLSGLYYPFTSNILHVSHRPMHPYTHELSLSLSLFLSLFLSFSLSLALAPVCMQRFD